MDTKAAEFENLDASVPGERNKNSADRCRCTGQGQKDRGGTCLIPCDYELLSEMLEAKLQQHHRKLSERLDLLMTHQDLLSQRVLQCFEANRPSPGVTQQLMRPMETLNASERSNGSPGGSLHNPLDNAKKISMPMLGTLNTLTGEDMKKKAAAQVTESRKSIDSASMDLRAVHTHGYPRIRKIVKNAWFEIFWAVLIVLNSLFMGIEVEVWARDPTQPAPIGFAIINHTCTVLFVFELALRVLATGRQFFKSTGWMWALVDIFVVVTSVIEMIFDILTMMFSSSALRNANNVRILRTIRITRLARTVRISRIVRFISSLRLLVISIAITLRELSWALVLLAIIIYVFAIALTQSAIDELANSSSGSDPELIHCWGSMSASMLTLFQSITGGVNWSEPLVPLSRISGVLTMVFMGYIAFTYFAVLNVLTGMFCNSAIENAQRDPDLYVQTALTTKRIFTQKLKRMFDEMNFDYSGGITLTELEGLMLDEKLMGYFEAMDLDVGDAWALFRLVDTDESQVIDVDDFVHGCLRLKGSAKNLDFATMLSESRWLRKRMSRFMLYVEHQFEEIHARMTLRGDNLPLVPLSVGYTALGTENENMARKHDDGVQGG
eukprot:gnl/TRDRNA2_/TRDRNA2_162416_c0_seq1.p1 gnl/TRDRNA2_/TRDRNA2_162416_c0~~gnl/TRDRNA2_/TRDRNA2_162416_c0_seq1.p1  ORF type:complete len:610 (+),score=82.05 gnl/TRDRNA2_/TRDRNA2_162416_c0_seq1:53-1882(+)